MIGHVETIQVNFAESVLNRFGLNRLPIVVEQLRISDKYITLHPEMAKFRMASIWQRSPLHYDTVIRWQELENGERYENTGVKVDDASVSEVQAHIDWLRKTYSKKAGYFVGPKIGFNFNSTLDGQSFITPVFSEKDVGDSVSIYVLTKHRRIG